jgi:hypothetical protein
MSSTQSVRTKHTTTAKVDGNAVGVKEEVTCDSKLIRSFVSSLTLRTADNKALPYESDGAIIFPFSVKKSKFLVDLLGRICIAQRIDMPTQDHFAVAMYKPVDAVDPKKIQTITINHCPSGIGGRALCCYGSNESACISIVGTAVRGNRTLMANDCLYLSQLHCPYLDFSFDTKTSFSIEAKQGFRKVVMQKDPTKRWIIVFDILATEKHAKELTEMFGGAVDKDDDPKNESEIDRFVREFDKTEMNVSENKS